MIFINNYLALVLRSVADHKRYLKIVLGLFALGLIVGALESEAASNLVQETMRNLIGRFKDAQGPGLFMRIFIHNLSAAAVASASGVLFGIFPVLSAFFNGFFIGTILAGVHHYTDWSFYQVILSLLPHGVFELPAFFLSLALGLRLGSWPFKKEKMLFLTETFNSSSSIFFKIIIPFLIIAAAIETAGIELLR